MSNKRLRKKQIKQRLVAEVSRPEPASPFELVEQVTTVPCPECAHPTMKRKFLPAAGNMNGTVLCPRCDLEAPYVLVLAKVMSAEDPLPEPIARAPVPSLPPPPMMPVPLKARFARWLASAQMVVAHWFGIRRRWSFARANSW